MTTARIKVAAGLTLTIAVAFGGGYAWARMVSQPEIVEIGSIACGVPPLTASFGVPLQAVLAAVGDLPFGVGPVDVPEGGGRVYLLFDPTADGKRRDVRLVDATLHLPTLFGQDEVAPKQITINCRDGLLGSVRYQGTDRETATFSVVRGPDTALTGARSARLGPTEPPIASPPSNGSP